MKTFSFAEITAQDIRHAIGSIEGIQCTASLCVLEGPRPAPGRLA